MKPSILRRAFHRNHVRVDDRSIAFLCVRVPLKAFGVDVHFPEDVRVGEPSRFEGVWEKKLEDGTVAKTLILQTGQVFGNFSSEPWMAEFVSAYVKYLGALDEITASPLGLEVQTMVDKSSWLAEFTVLCAQEGVLLVFGSMTSAKEERQAVKDLGSLCNRWIRRGIDLRVFRSIGIDPEPAVA